VIFKWSGTALICTMELVETSKDGFSTHGNEIAYSSSGNVA